MNISKEISFSKHEFGQGIIPELSTKLYGRPISAFREAISNGLDAMIRNSEKNLEKRIEIRTNVSPNKDIEIEDWGTGILDYQLFKVISLGKKHVEGEISSNEKPNEKIIGQKGMGKLSYLNLSEIGIVEFHSNNGSLGMQITMTKEGFTVIYKDSQLVLNHRGLKAIIKKAKGSLPDSKSLIEYLSKCFALRIARGAKIFVNGIKVNKPQDFDSNQFELFRMSNGISVYGNLNNVEKPKPNNVEIFVKQVYVDSKGFDYKVQGWLNCDILDLLTSRDGLYEGSNVYAEFMKKLLEHLDNNFEKKSQPEEREIKSGKQILNTFLHVIKAIHNYFPNMQKPLLSGSESNLRGMGSFSNIDGGPSSPCSENKGIIDETSKERLIIAKPIGNGKSHRHGKGESHARIKNGEGRILSPSLLFASGNGIIPEPKIVITESGKEKPIVYFNAPNRLVINKSWTSSLILLEANPRDPAIKSRILPLLVRAGLDAFPESSALSKDEWFKVYDTILEGVY